MKKAILMLLSGALVFVACRKEPVVDPVQPGDLSGVSARKVFVLNEGGMGSNNASLDVFDVNAKTYLKSVFKTANPEVASGLGDIGNDIAVIGDEVWVVVNNSGIVEVLSAVTYKEIAAIEIPTPRDIAFDGTYAYVSSWAGAYSNYSNPEDFYNPKGMVYRINLDTKQLDGSVEVGYQPEGLAVYSGKLYVANSGGISSSLAPDYSYDKTVSVISTESFTVSGTIDVQWNLKNVYSDGTGRIYVTSLGNYYDVHSGLYTIDASGAVSKVSDYVSVSAICGETVYFTGNPEEFDWSATSRTWTAFSCTGGRKSSLELPIESGAPYGLCALGGGAFLLADAGDYFNPGSVAFYKDGKKLWSVDSGVCPGHFAIW